MLTIYRPLKSANATLFYTQGLSLYQRGKSFRWQLRLRRLAPPSNVREIFPSLELPEILMEGPNGIVVMR